MPFKFFLSQPNLTNKGATPGRVVYLSTQLFNKHPKPSDSVLKNHLFR